MSILIRCGRENTERNVKQAQSPSNISHLFDVQIHKTIQPNPERCVTQQCTFFHLSVTREAPRLAAGIVKGGADPVKGGEGRGGGGVTGTPLRGQEEDEVGSYGGAEGRNKTRRAGKVSEGERLSGGGDARGEGGGHVVLPQMAHS